MKTTKLYALKQYYNKDSRGDTLGLFYTEKRALKLIENNTYDLAEGGFYKYVVVFPVEIDILYYVVDPDKEKWFEYSKEEKKYIPCSRPSSLDGFSIML